MARVQVGYNPRAEALQTTAQPNVQTEQVRYDPRASSAFQLAEALGKAQPIIDRFQEKYERDRLQDQLMKQDAYKAQFQQDWKGGAVTAAQVKEKFPEMVPVVAARVAESIGLDEGKKRINAVIDEINTNDALRLDSRARDEFIQKKRTEILGQIGSGNEFFSAGVIKGMDQELAGWGNGWQRETATYHTKMQAEAFTNEVGQILNGGGDIGTGLVNLDTKWGTTSSLNNQERKKAVVDTVINRAYATDDPSLLSKIPTVFLNEESKKQLKQAELQIQQIRIGKVRDAKFLEATQREEATRGAKVEMISTLAQGGQIDPAKYRGDPEAFNYAMQLKDAGRLPDTQSVANSTKIRTAILNGSTVGTMNQNQVIDQIMANPSINPKEKQALIAEVPKLMEGMLIMRDESVTSAMSNRLDPVIKAIETGPFARVFQVQGINIRGQAMSMFQTDLQASMLAWYEDPNLGKGQQWPTGMAKQELIRAAIERTETNITKMTEMYTKAGAGGAQAPVPTPSGPARTVPPAPAGANAPVRIRNAADYNALKPGTVYITPDGQTKTKQ